MDGSRTTRVHPAVTYALMQLPGAALVALGLYYAAQAQWLSGRLAVALLVLWLVKDVLLYPLYRHALEEGPVSELQAMVGRRAVARSGLDPSGLVSIGGERWRARTAAGHSVTAGQSVRVVATDGLVLVVEPDE